MERNRLTYGEKTAGISAILLFAWMSKLPRVEPREYQPIQLLRAVLTVLVASVLVSGFASPANAKVVGTSYTGKHPFFSFAIAGLIQPSHLAFKVTSRTPEPLIVRVQLKCSHRKGGPWQRIERKFTAKPPISRSVGLPKRPLSGCVYSVTATRHRVGGWIAVTLFGQASRVL